MKDIYLARNGRIHGPYNEAQVEEMRASGAITAFSWIWDGSTPGWEALDPAPAELPNQAGVKISKAVAPIAPAPSRDDAPRVAPVIRDEIRESVSDGLRGLAPALQQMRALKKPLSAICHDYRHSAWGFVKLMGDSGCELEFAVEANDVRFAPGAKLQLNLLDESTGKAQNVDAVLDSVSRRNGHVVILVRFEKARELSAIA